MGRYFAITVALIFLIACSKENTNTGKVYPTPTAYSLERIPLFPANNLPANNPLTLEGIELGRALFYDPILSGDNTQSCASCHNSSFGFTDNGRRFSQGISGQLGTRNSMPLFNLQWNNRFFWDGRSTSLQSQVLIPIEDPIEMHEQLPNAIMELQALPFYKDKFGRAFGDEKVDATRIAKALEQFLLIHVSGRSKYDLAILGLAQLSASEQRGLDLFRAEFSPPGSGRPAGADCFHCHGTVLFTNNQFLNNGLDSVFTDIGLQRVTGSVSDRGKFKVPSLRNVELTAPYMHDGRFNSLEEVVEHYNSGIKSSPTLDPNMKSQGSGLGLNPQQKADLVAFLKALTDTSYVNNPLLQNPFAN